MALVSAACFAVENRPLDFFSAVEPFAPVERQALYLQIVGVRLVWLQHNMLFHNTGRPGEPHLQKCSWFTEFEVFPF